MNIIIIVHILKLMICYNDDLFISFLFLFYLFIINNIIHRSFLFFFECFTYIIHAHIKLSDVMFINILFYSNGVLVFIKN